MKRFIFVLLAIFALMFSSCQKIETPGVESDMVEATFTLSVVNGYIPTKGLSDEVLNNLPYDYPTQITFYGGSTGKYVLDLTKGNTISLQKGTYYLEATSGKFSDENIFSQTCVPLAAGFGSIRIGSNTYTMVQSFEITESKAYNIELKIAGFIIACDKNEVSHFKWEQICDTSQRGKNLKETNRFETENYYYYILSMPKTILANGDNRFTRFGVELGETEKNEKTYKEMAVSAGGDRNVVGKYFLYLPVENSFREFGFSVGNWENGGEK